MEVEPEVGMSFAHADGMEVRPKRRCAPMKVLIGVDPHKTSVALAAVDEARGELLEGACFPQDRAGCECSRPETPARTTGSMPSPPRLPPRATRGLRRSIQRPPPGCYACFPRGAGR